MTPVLVATHDDGVVRVYLRHPDGTVTQTARFVAATIEPPALAALVADLNDELFWHGAATPEPVKPAPVKAIATHDAPKKKPKVRRAGHGEMQALRDDMLAWLTAHGPATAVEAAQVSSPKRSDPVGGARSLLDQLVDRGLAAKTPGPHRNAPCSYRALIHIPIQEQQHE